MEQGARLEEALLVPHSPRAGGCELPGYGEATLVSMPG
jgi:hypothetical protein